VEEVREAWTRRWRRSVVLTVVHGHAGEGRADSAIPGCFNVEEERDAGMEEERGDGVEEEQGDGVEEKRGDGVEAHADEGAWWWAYGGGGHEGGVGTDGCVVRKRKG
jgi:hypothetical protein